MPGRKPRCAGAVCDRWVLFPPLPLLKLSTGKGAGPALSAGSAKWQCQEKWSKERITAWSGSGILCRAGDVSVHPPPMHICGAWTVDMVPFCHCWCFSFCSFMEKQMNVCPLHSPAMGGSALCSFLCKICPAFRILCLKQQKQKGPFTQLKYLSLPLPKYDFDPNLSHSSWPKKTPGLIKAED